ncbi:hypothetical protein [Aquimarina longa]|uniref:hypothetical protein n=1 Tax=Aquimarina longa TaxID=1080221 RepID=UPI000783EEE6|nr:hypothetical protein [Aquimarina longa]
MDDKKNIEIEFYQNLGKLFYAIAIADKVIQKSEYNLLRKIVKSEWSKTSLIEDEFGIDAIYQIEIVFDWLDYEEELNAEEYFEQFEVYYKENTTYFTDSVKESIWDTTNTIAGVFSGKNKSELILLGRLKLILENTAIK